MALSLPVLLGTVVDAPIALVGDSGKRRALVLGGGVVFGGSLLLFATAPDLVVLLVAVCLSWFGSGAFVGLSHATWMDLDPARTERNMATWVVAGSVGAVLGPAILGVTLSAGGSWRDATVLAVVPTLPALVAASRIPFPAPHPDAGDLRHAFSGAMTALRTRSVLRWLVLLEVTDLLQDVFLGYVAVYLVDVAAASPARGGLGVAVLATAGLVGDVALVALLRWVDGVRSLRWSAAAMLIAYPTFLIVPGATAKIALLAPIGLLRAGWYAILEGRLYAELPGRGGTTLAIKSPIDLLGAALPFAIGVTAQRVGLEAAMWLLLAAPIALLTLLPRRRRGATS